MTQYDLNILLQKAFSHYQSGDLQNAEIFYAEILKKDPNHFDALHMSAVISHRHRQWKRAEEFFLKAISVDPASSAVYSHYGLSLHRLGRMDEAIQCFNKALSLEPEFPHALNNRGNVFQDLFRFEDALADYDSALAIKPDYAELFLSRGAVLQSLRRFDEALDSYEGYRKLRGEDSEWSTNKALALLLLGRFAEGFALYEGRAKEASGSFKFGNAKLWDGETNVSGRSILVHWEQGLGDTIQFCRYLSILSKMGARVSFAPQAPLRSLMSSLSGGIEIVVDGNGSQAFDYHVSLLSLPAALKTDLSTIPDQVPYLAADSSKIANWKERIGASGFKIGICWQGSSGKVDAGRSFALKWLQEISHIPGVRLISLHKGDGEAQLADLPADMLVETLGDGFDEGGDAFIDSAAVIKNCDLVITSDTAIAHLAGALGVRTWVALRCVPDWRWLLDRNDNPWYPNVRLFRQRAPGDWSGAFEDIRNALLEAMATDKNPSFEKASEPSGFSHHKRVFNAIYERNLRGNGSGSGSTPANTRDYRIFLSNFIKANKVSTIVDLGCGDWQFSRLMDWGGASYIGIDVSDVVLENTRSFRSDRISFIEMDAVTGDPPSADLLLVKDVFQHWSNSEILSFLPKLRRYKKALITNGFHSAGLHLTNHDIAAGGWRPIDLAAPPFNVRGSYIHWYDGGEPKWVFLWERDAS